MLAQFQSITGIEDAQRANFFLESSNWNVDLAISSFFDDPEPLVGVGSQAMNPPPQEVEDASSTGRSENKETSSSNVTGGAPTNFGTSADIDEAMDSDGSDTDDDSGQAFYAGAGQQIIGPSKKKTGANLVQEMLKKAKESGAEAVDPSSRDVPSSSGATAFVGSGYKLGSSETAPSEMVSGSKKSETPQTIHSKDVAKWL